MNKKFDLYTKDLSEKKNKVPLEISPSARLRMGVLLQASSDEIQSLLAQGADPLYQAKNSAYSTLHLAKYFATPEILQALEIAGARMTTNKPSKP